MYKIPFNKPFIVGKELFYIAQTVLLHGHTAGDGIFTKKCQAENHYAKNGHTEKDTPGQGCDQDLQKYNIRIFFHNLILCL